MFFQFNHVDVNVTCGFSFRVITFHVVICVIDSCLHITGQWIWLYNFMIPSNNATHISRQTSASVLTSIRLISICFSPSVFFFFLLWQYHQHFILPVCRLLCCLPWFSLSCVPQSVRQFVIFSFWCGRLWFKQLTKFGISSSLCFLCRHIVSKRVVTQFLIFSQ